MYNRYNNGKLGASLRNVPKYRVYKQLGQMPPSTQPVFNRRLGVSYFKK